jgi:hypothetical protein
VNDHHGLREAIGRKGSFLQTVKAVAWAFFGVRRKAEYERDVGHLNPVHLIIAALVAAALFVIVLVVLIRYIVASGVAA